MTRAFLQLLNTLTDVPVPPGLGAGLRAPGFDPYLDFLVHGVLLKFNTRAYKEAGEKVNFVAWRVVSPGAHSRKEAYACVCVWAAGVRRLAGEKVNLTRVSLTLTAGTAHACLVCGC